MNKLILTSALFLCYFGLVACTDGPSKSEQEKIIRETFPKRLHEQKWENSFTLFDLHQFYEQQPHRSDGFMYYVVWENAKKGGYLEPTREKVRNSDESEYSKSYSEYFNQYYSDYYDDGTPDVDLMQKDYLNIYNYSNVPSKQEIFEYMIGHMKACTYTPTIIAMEFIKDKSIGSYWLVHFSEGASRKVHFFKKDDGMWDYAVLKMN